MKNEKNENEKEKENEKENENENEKERKTKKKMKLTFQARNPMINPFWNWKYEPREERQKNQEGLVKRQWKWKERWN